MIRLRNAALLLVSMGVAIASPPDPSEFAGFPIGSDGNLVRWEKIVEYFEMLDRTSGRVQVEELGKSTNGNPFIVAVISSPANIARLGEIRQTQRRIAFPEGLTPQEIERIAWSSPAVVFVSCNIHATEIGSSQMALELAHRMAFEDSPWMRNVLDNVIFLLAPSINPDGQIMVVDWNNRVRGTKHVWAPLPWLYHPYVGHDNNRDAFLMTQAESRYVNKVLYQDWFPQVYVDEHQQGADGMRVFVPPFRNPINPNVDPAIWAQAGQIGFAMYQRLHEAGFSGVGYDQKYTAWWQGGFLRGAWFHNIVGVLTEVASANLASPVYQQMARLGHPPSNPPSRQEWFDQREKDPDAPMPPPADVMPRYDYPRPWLGGKWTLRDIVDAELALTNALLETAANNRVKLIETQIRLGLEAIEAGANGGPRAWVFPPGQHDPGALYRLLEVLHYCGVQVDRARAPFEAEGESYPAGAFVISMAQPFRAYAKDLLEPQEHPDPQKMPAGKMGDQPYDQTAWSLPLQMGVEAVRVDSRFDADLERLKEIPRPKGKLLLTEEPAAGYFIKPEPNSLAILINRLLKSKAAVALAASAVDVDGGGFAPGSLWVPAPAPDGLSAWVEELGLEGAALAAPPDVSLTELRQPRVALYRPWTASMDEGWTRWLLEQYEFAFTPVFDADLRGGGLNELWDVILLPGDRGDARLVEGNNRKSTPEEFRGGMGEKGRRELRRFVERGGTLVTWGAAAKFALRTFELPLRDALSGVPRARFSGPGVFLRIEIDNTSPLAYGMPSQGIAVFNDDPVFDETASFRFTQLRTVARYPSEDLLASGWIRGGELLSARIAAADVDYKKGRVVLAGFRPQFRAQPHNTFKLLFNAIHSAGAR